MSPDENPKTVRPLFEIGSEIPANPEMEQEIQDRKGEAKKVIKRLAAIFEDHKDAALPLKIKLGSQDLRLVIKSLRNHAKGGNGSPVSGSRDEIHGYCLNRLFDELVEEPLVVVGGAFDGVVGSSWSISVGAGSKGCGV